MPPGAFLGFCMSSKTFAPYTRSSPVPGTGQAWRLLVYPGDLQVSTHMALGVIWEAGMMLLEGKDLSTQSSRARSLPTCLELQAQVWPIQKSSI